MQLGLELPIISAMWILLVLCIVTISERKNYIFWKNTILIFIAVMVPIIGSFYPMHFYFLGENIPKHYMGVLPFRSLLFFSESRKWSFVLLNLVLFLPLGILYENFFQEKIKKYVMEFCTIVAFFILIYIENKHAGVVLYSWDLGICSLHLLSLACGNMLVRIYKSIHRRRKL